jgi:hypothetical protein
MTSYITGYMPQPSTPQSLNKEMTRLVHRVETLVEPRWMAWLKLRYSSRGYAIYLYTTASKYLKQVLLNPTLLRNLPYRRARAVLEALAALRDYARVVGVEFEVDGVAKFLKRFMPPKRVEEVTEALLEYELEEGNGKDIIAQAVDAVKLVMSKETMFKVPALVAFFTGLRSTEIKHMLDRWFELRKIEVVEGAILVELNYDRNKKKAYICLLPKELVPHINTWVKENRLTANWKDHLRHRYGVRVGLFRKAFQAITARYLDKAERELLLGHLKSIQVRHYIRHIKSIAQRYRQAYEPYIKELLSNLSG